MNESRFADMKDDLPFAAEVAPTAAPIPTKESAIAAHFEQTCRKCNGSKVFRSFSGRILGACFACKGAGSVTFETSPETRAKARTATVARKEKTDAAKWIAFVASNPAEARWIESNPTFDFASKMQAAVHQYGSLTENQLGAIRRCVDRDAGRAVENAGKAVAEAARVAAAPAMTLEPVEKAFQNAREAGIRYPRLNLDVFTFKPAKVGGSNEGAIYVTERGEYLGKVMGGKFVRTRECSDEQQAKILEIGADPLAAAVAYGKRFGSCAVCRRELTNEESIERGIGPICAEKFGW